MLHEDITSDIIAAFYTVYNTLGYGFLEKVYENALAIELEKRGHSIKQQIPIQVYYEERVVGDYFADMLADDKIIIELKAADEIVKAHEAQLVNYLKATKIQEVCFSILALNRNSSEKSTQIKGNYKESA